jgi:hypothetical protein
MKTKFAMMASVGAIALSASSAWAAVGESPAKPADPAYVQLAQNLAPASNAEMEARIDALEAELQDAEMRQAQATNNPPPAPSGWWSNTSVSGRMYFDLSNIDHESNGAKTGNADNGTNFDIKRFYVGIDHVFSPVFMGDITTDVTYDGATGASQIFIKKAFLQAKLDPALTIRLGSADLPWIPYAEGVYGYRYLENTLIDRTKFGTSADWGVHLLGSLFDNIVSYDFAAVNGGGYKKIPVGGGANRFKQFDFEGRISAAYDGFNVGIGGYTGKLGVGYGTSTFHTANRFDALAAYVADGLRLGVEYFSANDFSTALVTANAPGDSAHGISGFGSYYFLPEWAVFGRYDSVDPNTKVTPLKHDDYYTLGLTWSPTKIVDFSLAYKHDTVGHGTLSTSNGTIGGSTSGSYSEIGLFGDFQW